MLEFENILNFMKRYEDDLWRNSNGISANIIHNIDI